VRFRPGRIQEIAFRVIADIDAGHRADDGMQFLGPIRLRVLERLLHIAPLIHSGERRRRVDRMGYGSRDALGNVQPCLHQPRCDLQARIGFRRSRRILSISGHRHATFHLGDDVMQILPRLGILWILQEMLADPRRELRQLLVISLRLCGARHYLYRSRIVFSLASPVPPERISWRSRFATPWRFVALFHICGFRSKPDSPWAERIAWIWFCLIWAFPWTSSPG